MSEVLEQPGMDMQEKLSEVMNAEPTEIVWRGHKRKIGWMRHAVQRKFTTIMLKNTEETEVWKQNVKLCACLLLNGQSGFWTMMRETFCYPVYWRWLYYVKQVDMVEVLQVIAESKKKIQIEPCLMCTILATEMTDTMMTMRSQEAKATQAAHVGAVSSL